MFLNLRVSRGVVFVLFGNTDDLYYVVFVLFGNTDDLYYVVFVLFGNTDDLYYLSVLLFLLIPGNCLPFQST